MLGLTLSAICTRGVRQASSGVRKAKREALRQAKKAGRPKPPPFTLNSERSKLRKERQAMEELEQALKIGPGQRVAAADQLERDPAPHVGRKAVPHVKARSRAELKELLRRAGQAEGTAMDRGSSGVDAVNSSELLTSEDDVREALSAADADGPFETPSPAESDPMEMLEHLEITAKEIPISPVQPPRQAPVARLGRRLQKVLFSPGVHMLRDPRTGIWNFDERLASIPKPEEFAFHRLPQYITASEDDELAKMSEGDGLQYIGSTSTLTQSLSQIYFAMSGGRGVDISTLSRGFDTDYNAFTAGAQLPAIIALKKLPNGRFAIDNDKRFAIEENILSDYGRILEKLLTSEPDDFGRFMKSAPETAVSTEERTAREAYCYSRSAKLLMRSQLDCQDNRLPGLGTFDIKTRACYPIRHDRANYAKNSDYDISEHYGPTRSFEREYFDLTRSGMMKYCLQARIGQMDGIFVAYHNTVRCFGFQYLPLSELDQRLFGSTEVAEQVFSLCVGILERILTEVTAMFPDQELSLTISHKRQAMDYRTGKPSEQPHNELEVTAQPLNKEEKGAPAARALRFQFTNKLDGEVVGVDMPQFSEDPTVRKRQEWGLDYKLSVSPDDAEGQALARKWRSEHVRWVTGMNRLYVPEGMTPNDMVKLGKEKSWKTKLAAQVEAQKQWALKATKKDRTEEDEEEAVEAVLEDKTGPAPARVTWVLPNDRIAQLRLDAKASGEDYARRAAQWKNPGRWWDGENEESVADKVAEADVVEAIESVQRRGGGETAVRGQ